MLLLMLVLLQERLPISQPSLLLSWGPLPEAI
jgi:hypothetical protein